MRAKSFDKIYEKTIFFTEAQMNQCDFCKEISPKRHMDEWTSRFAIAGISCITFDPGPIAIYSVTPQKKMKSRIMMVMGDGKGDGKVL